MADALASGASDRKVVQVQVLFPAPADAGSIRIQRFSFFSEELLFCILPLCYTDRMSDDNLVQPSESRQQIRTAVTALAQAVHRKGGLAGPAYAGVQATDGIRLHQRFSKNLEASWPDASIQSEVSLEAQFATDLFDLVVSGRCDALIEQASGPVIIEAKSYNGQPDKLPEKGEDVHWAQAMIYGWIYLNSRPELSEMEIGLVYLAQESKLDVSHRRTHSRGQLQDFFIRTCEAYIQQVGDVITGARLRLASGLDCPFPYGSLRSGQKRMMQEVIGTARQTGLAFVQAPTGTGKTMAALFPAVRALANKLTEHCFYLTNMTSTRLFAQRAVADLQACGLRMKCIVLYAKEKLCLQRDLYCDSRRCPYATAYYDHLPDALRHLFLVENIGETEILEAARRFKVCPFELALDMAVFCEIIICDYNYAFDPRIRLDRFFGQDSKSHLLLVDEAHNLPSRSRNMFSAALDRQGLLKAQAAVKGHCPPLEVALGAILGYMDRLSENLGSELPGLDNMEKDFTPDKIMIADKFRAARDLPKTLLSLLGRMIWQCREYLEQDPDIPNRRHLLDYYFSALYFGRVAEEYFDDTYVLACRQDKDNTLVSLLCLDAADKLAATYAGRHPAVFFSATLSPINYYVGLIAGKGLNLLPQTLLLGSPFPTENLLVTLCSALSTRYRQRSETLESICDMVFAAIQAKVGNYLVYVPSFAYLQMFRNLLKAMPNRPDASFIFQTSNMSEAQRRKFLDQFERFGQKTLVAVAVMGGIFSEGIDLVGDKLAGVVVIGVGLPQISPEREIMKQYYGEVMGSGYEFAYLYPGFNKVQQAAGRVIRTEEDRGFVLLIDDRYATPAYHSLFPAEWKPVDVQDGEELSSVLSEFWSDI